MAAGDEEGVRALLLRYAERGVTEWMSAPSEVKASARNCLGRAVVDNLNRVHHVVHAAFYASPGADVHVLPMPRIQKLGWGFFLPIREGDTGQKHSFHVCLLVDAENSLGLRFEPAHEVSTSHGYSHVQFSRDLIQGALHINGVPDWLPDSYPAIPIRARNTLEMFLAVGVSLHGFGGKQGMLKLLQSLFQTASQASLVASYVTTLRGLLGES